MALRGKYEQSHVMVKVFQWLGCIFLLSIPAMGSIALFPQPVTTEALKWVQLIQTAALFLLPPFLMAFLWTKQPLEWLKLKSETKGYGLWAIFLMLIALPAINLVGYFNQQMSLPAFLEPLEQWMKTAEENAAHLTEQFLSVTTFDGLIINILLMALLPAVAEELTFRGVLQRLIQTQTNEAINREGKWVHLAIWCTAILFSAIHMQFYGFLPRMLMGALFGYALVWTGSMWIPILMHFTNNAMAVILYFLAIRSGWDMN
jgi:membrane protease YdiL (CAAX protease family)